MTFAPPPSRSLKDRLTKAPDWFKPKTPLAAAYGQMTLRGIQKREELQRRRVEAAKASALGKAADIVRRMDVRAKSFLGGKAFPWTPDAWNRIQLSRYKKQHPIRYYVYRLTGLMAPTL